VTVLETFADFAAHIEYRALPAVEREIVSLHLLDTVGAAIAGRRTPNGESLRELQAPKGAGLAIWNAGTIDDVAVRVGTVRHTEIDDIHNSSNVTPSSVIVPSTLTMCARLGISDPALIGSALLSGYEAILRLGMVIDGPVVMYQGIWPTFFCAPFGAAAATARLLNLSTSATAHALANALTLCTGGTGAPGPYRPGRWFVIGEAARGGVAAALAAANGFTADLGLLDGKWLSQSHGLQGKPSALTDGLGGKSIVTEISMKPCCTGKQVTAALTAFQKILEQGGDPGAATKIDVYVPKRYAAMIDRRVMPGTNRSTSGNTRYQFALAAYDPDGLFDPARIARKIDARMDALMDKVSIVVDDSLERHLPRLWPARVELTTAAKKFVETVVAAPGDPDLRLDASAVRRKFHRLTDRLIGERNAEHLISVCNKALVDARGSEHFIAEFEKIFAAN
jgi:2-methylcitrate dehydratase PrpD